MFRPKVRTSLIPVLALLAACTAESGKDGNSCSVKSNADDSATVSCTDGTTAVVHPKAAAPGADGIDGKDGADGKPGPAGADGADGVAGLDGKDGADGVAGLDGKDGANGVAGLDGKDGANGLDGTNCTIAVEQGLQVVKCGDGTSAVLGSVPSASGARRRHVILVIGDGMQLAHEISASRYLFGTDNGLSFHKFPVKTSCTTWDVTTYNAYAQRAAKPNYSPLSFDPSLGYDPAQGGTKPYPLQADGPGTVAYLLTGATDSASAATAMSTGKKTDGGNIAWLPGDPANGALETSAERLRRQRGMAIGVVSTVPFNHATPAAWIAHNVSRNNYEAIGLEIIQRTMPEVVIGGGYNSPDYKGSAMDAALVADSDWTYVKRTAGVDGGQALLAAAEASKKSGKRLFGLFGAPASGNFESPTPAHAPGNPSVTRVTQENPSLSQASIAAIQRLASDPDGFFLTIEQGDIDWANHANDFSRMIGTVWDLDETVKAILAYVDQPGDALDWSNTTVLVTSDHGNSLLRLPQTLGKGVLPKQLASGNSFTYPDGDVTYGTGNHTNELVGVYAIGASAWSVYNYEGIYNGLPIIENSSLYQWTFDAAGY